MTAPPRLLLPGAVLRDWQDEDAPALVAAHQDPDVRRWSGALVDDEETAREVAVRRAEGWAERRSARWVVADPTDGHLVGVVGLDPVQPDLACGSVGYWLLPEARGRGIASAAVCAVARVAFGELGWVRLELHHSVTNPRSCGVAARAGFPLEGTLRQAMRYPATGEWSDEHLHARLASDPPPE